MKRMMTILLVLILLLGAAVVASGEAAGTLRGYVGGEGYVYVTLGQYPQRIEGGLPEERNNTWTWASHTIADPSSVTIYTDPILWRVLTVDEEKAWLCSEYVLFAMPMHTNVTEYKKIGKDFGQTDLSHYLNSKFAEQAFSQEEQDMLLLNGSVGKVFLLEAKDVKNRQIGMGTGRNKGLKAWATEYAVRITKAFVYKVAYGAHSPYWVQDQASSDPRHARCTKERGELGHIVADRDNEGVRPAVWLAMDSFEIQSGAGTKEDPFVIAPRGTESNV